MPENTLSVDVVAKYARRLPDPVFENAHRHVLIVRAADVPANIPLDPNPRDQKIDRRVYKDVLASLMNEDGAPDAFHLKNKGITVIAAGVIPSKRNKSKYTIHFEPGQGIVDGGHTYRIVQEGQQREGLPEQQYVKIEVLVGIQPGLNTDIAGGLNTGLQVQETSLANLDGKFDWIKDTLAGEPYDEVIAYRENEADKAMDVRDVIAFMHLFNIEKSPNDGTDYPTSAYHARHTVLREFLAPPGPGSYMKLRKILPDILELSDIVSYEAAPLHNASGGRAGGLAFVDHREKGFDFPFIGKHGEYKLAKGALIPMLGAFRWMIEESPEGDFRWKGSFEDVKKLWAKSAGELMRTTQGTSDQVGRKPDAIGKNRNHWITLHSIVIKNQLTG